MSTIATKYVDVYCSVVDRKRLIISFHRFPPEKVDNLARINGKALDHSEIGLDIAIDEFRYCLRKTFEGVCHVKKLEDHQLLVTLFKNTEPQQIADQIMALLRLHNISSI